MKKIQNSAKQTRQKNFARHKNVGEAVYSQCYLRYWKHYIFLVPYSQLENVSSGWQALFNELHVFLVEVRHLFSS